MANYVCIVMWPIVVQRFSSTNILSNLKLPTTQERIVRSEHNNIINHKGYLNEMLWFVIIVFQTSLVGLMLLLKENLGISRIPVFYHKTITLSNGHLDQIRNQTTSTNWNRLTNVKKLLYYLTVSERQAV